MAKKTKLGFLTSEWLCGLIPAQVIGAISVLVGDTTAKIVGASMMIVSGAIYMIVRYKAKK